MHPVNIWVVPDEFCALILFPAPILATVEQGLFLLFLVFLLAHPLGLAQSVVFSSLVLVFIGLTSVLFRARRGWVFECFGRGRAGRMSRSIWWKMASIWSSVLPLSRPAALRMGSFESW